MWSYDRERGTHHSDYAVTLTPRDEPAPVPYDDRCDWPDAVCEAYDAALRGNKLGGAPGWVQFEETPGEGYALLLQLEMGDVPFKVNFGDCGAGYAFLAPDGRSGKFLWQCG